MTKVARLIGGAGTGKTHRLLRTMELLIGQGYHPMQIGFASFTRAARAEAAARAAAVFGCSQHELENEGWFRTAHSFCYRCLNVAKSSLVTSDTASRKWLSEVMGQKVKGMPGEDGMEMDWGTPHDLSHADIVLELWDRCRNRLVPFGEAWEAARVYSMHPPPGIESCRLLVERYEQAKRLDGVSDFTDLLGSFAGWRFGFDGHARATPRGQRPELPVMFFDEQQDASPLLTSVCQRLSAGATYVYLAGDPFQSIYQWAGADHRCFLGYPANKEETMPKSYRCAAPILELGESILRPDAARNWRGCSDWWDRRIAPADHAGVVSRQSFNGEFWSKLDPRENWLILARTNRFAAWMMSRLNRYAIPWTATKGKGGWIAPSVLNGLQALLSLEEGRYIDGAQWAAAVKLLRSGNLLVHGTKARLAQENNPAARWPRLGLGRGLREAGATEALEYMLLRREWYGEVEDAALYRRAVSGFGADVAHNPRVRVGTVHSAKGREADNVAVLTSLSVPCVRARQTISGNDEEARVWYVAVTRARQRVVLLEDFAEPNRMRLPA